MNLILDAIRRVTENVRADEKAFIENTADIYIEESRKLNREQERQIAQKEERRKTVDRLMMKLYEDRTASVIPEKHFERMLEEYGTEYDSLEVEIDNLKAEIAERENSAVKTDKFVEIVRKYTDITELTPAILNEFVEKVIVHERTGTRGNYHQKIEIFFKFVGQLEPE